MTQLMPAQQRAANVRTLLEKSKAQIALALPKHMNAERMMRIALTSVQRTPKLLECEPISLIGAVIQASQLGLEPDGVLGQAYLIPYYNGRKKVNEVQFQPGYKGLLALARRSGEIGAVDTRVVCEKDQFSYAFGLEPKLFHIPAALEDRGPCTYVYAVVRLKDGSSQFDVMSRGEIEAHRKHYSRASEDGPWQTAWDEMAKKTVLKRVLKLAPASVELQKAIALDEHAEAGLPQDLDAVAMAETGLTPEKPKALDALADKLEADKPAAAPPQADEPPHDEEMPSPVVVETQQDEEQAARRALVSKIADKLNGVARGKIRELLEKHGLRSIDAFDTCDLSTLDDIAKELKA
jgi:recombination protein RecT